jgi:tellurite resistance protein
LIRITQVILRAGRRGPLHHPFRDFSKVSNRCASRTLQRRIADFSAERSFKNTALALKEHYQIEVPIYTIDKATADIAQQAKRFNAQTPETTKPAAILISQVDGSMLPIVGFKEAEESADPVKIGDSAAPRVDKRKLRQCHWKEIRVSTVRVPDSEDTYYGVAVGEPLVIGTMMLDCCKFKGMNATTKIHAIADGASWIANQYDMQFGDRCTFLVDFYHVCEYLAEASRSTTMDQKERNCWVENQKQSLRASDIQSVINALETLESKEQNKDKSDPIRTAINYLENRRHQLNYKQALDQKLPIGSGEVESAHRHILQKRLKIPGAWWRLARAEEMAQLRAMRANNRWNEFWQDKSA